jgi:hypothetical protein
LKVQLPPLLPVSEIQERLESLFPAGTKNRNYVTREMAAKTVFVMLYLGAVEDSSRWLRPDQVTRMTDAQVVLTGDRERNEWLNESMSPTPGNIEGRWYAANTREPIRDETLRGGLVRTGAVKERRDLPTTSPRPRYALARDFASLFDPALVGEDLESATTKWQADNLSGGALARVTILRRGAVAGEDRVLITFPNGETRRMEPGPSSVISKAVVEDFASRFLERPGVIWLSDSRNHVVERDDRLAQDIGLWIRPDRQLPDLILADLGSSQALLVFVEVVATAGPVDESRQAALMAIAVEGGFTEEHVAFVSAYSDRDEAVFKRSVGQLAWRSFAWFMSEPDHIVVLHRGSDIERVRLSELMRVRA